MKNKQQMIHNEEYLFTHPYTQKGDIFRHNKEIIPLYLKLKDTRDERSLVLLSSLISEFLIDKLLNTVLPDYKRIQENRDFSHSMKEDLLFSTKLIPNHIIECSKVIRKIRNEFAHNLDIDSLEKINKNLKDIMKTCCEKIPGQNGQTPKEIRKLFEKIQNHAIQGLSSYHPNLKIFRNTVYTTRFRTILESQSLTENNLYDRFMASKAKKGTLPSFSEAEYENWRKKYRKD